ALRPGLTGCNPGRMLGRGAAVIRPGRDTSMSSDARSIRSTDDAGLDPGLLPAGCDPHACRAATGEGCVPIQSFADVVVARQHGRALPAQAGFDPSERTMIASAIAEVTQNILDYAGSGEISIAVVTHGARTGVRIVARDEGPGIADLALAMRDGYSS